MIVTVAAVAGLGAGALADTTPHEKAGNAVAYQFKELEDPHGPFVVMQPDAVFSVLGPEGDGGEVVAAKLKTALYGAGKLESHRLEGLHPGMARDGNTFWFQVQSVDRIAGKAGPIDVRYRASEIAVRTKDGFRIAGGMWSVGVPNADANRAASAGKLPALAPVAAGQGDAAVIAAFQALFAKGLDPAAAARKELFAMGSAPDEDTRTGRELARAWKGAWVGRAEIEGAVRATLAPSGTTAWVVANVKLTKTKGTASYPIPFRVLVVFDKVGGKWSVVHAHFATPLPPAG